MHPEHGFLLVNIASLWPLIGWCHLAGLITRVECGETCYSSSPTLSQHLIGWAMSFWPLIGWALLLWPLIGIAMSFWPLIGWALSLWPHIGSLSLRLRQTASRGHYFTGNSEKRKNILLFSVIFCLKVYFSILSNHLRNCKFNFPDRLSGMGFSLRFPRQILYNPSVSLQNAKYSLLILTALTVHRRLGTLRFLAETESASDNLSMVYWNKQSCENLLSDFLSAHLEENKWLEWKDCRCNNCYVHPGNKSFYEETRPTPVLSMKSGCMNYCQAQVQSQI